MRRRGEGRSRSAAESRSSTRQLVVVGNGMVGQRFVEALRERDQTGTWQVTVLGEEPRPAYDRVALTSYLTGTTADELSLVSDGWYDGEMSALRLGDPAVTIDRSARTVTTSTGRVLPYWPPSRTAGARTAMTRSRRDRHVAIIGGGPGDPELITVRGYELLKQADVVLVDRLAPRELLAGLRPDVEMIDVGKEPHRHRRSQTEIEALIIEHARAGRRVVRLKGGDPYVFGRGGEEAAARVVAGVPVTVVPGVTSAVAVPAAAGIPVTHRGLTQELTIVSGHAHPDDPACTVDWDRLAAGRGTIVVLMGVYQLPAIVARLVAGGRRPDTPAAVIQNGTMPGQRVVTAPLADIVEAASDVVPPAVVVIGDVVQLGL